MKKHMKTVRLALMIFFLGVGLIQFTPARAANPYLPHWEHIPDGEPRLFEDPDNPGKYRVYIYGSHDTRKTAYCGYDLVTWSAPVEDLNDWRYEGVIFESIVDGEADVLFAPDVVEKKDSAGNKTYYLYPNNQSSGRGGMIAKSDSPVGPFEVCNWSEGSSTETDGELGFDPAVFIDDDGRVYGYWGFQSSNMAELDPDTMCTVKEGCDILGESSTGIDGSEKGDNFRFFEASSLRKVGDKYVFIYSRKTKVNEFGLGASNNTLAYAYGDTPLGPWTYGGTLIDARARETDQNGNPICAMQGWGNTHGSILEINGQWYVFYHRCINNSMFSRQAMVEAIDVNVTEDGKVEISEAEVTSQGFEINGLNPYKKQAAGSACFVTGGPLIEAHYNTSNPGSSVVDINKGSIVGYKYLNFDAGKGTRDKNMIAVDLVTEGVDGTIEIMLDRPWESNGGTRIGTIEISEEDGTNTLIKTAEIKDLDTIKGKHALYFVFQAGEDVNKYEILCSLRAFQFGESTVTDADEGQDPKKPEPTATPDGKAPLASAAPAGAAPTSTAPVNTAAPVATTGPDENLPKKGTSVTVGSYVYKITKPDATGKGTVTLTGTKKKKAGSIKVPDTITVKKVKYRVTEIGKSAFKGCKKAASLVVGKNVAQIGSQAFRSCSKMKKITFKTEVLKKIGKNAFKGIHSKAKITVPKKQKNKYKKMLKKPQGIKKTMKIK